MNDLIDLRLQVPSTERDLPHAASTSLLRVVRNYYPVVKESGLSWWCTRSEGIGGCRMRLRAASMAVDVTSVPFYTGIR